MIVPEKENNHDSDTLTKFFVQHLGRVLYQIYHCRQEDYEKEIHIKYTDHRDFVESLSRANISKGTWEPGWEIHKIEKNGHLAVHKDGLTLWVMPQQFSTGSKEKIKVGEKGHISMVKEFRNLLPGFYMANGNAPLDQGHPLTRIYWNIKSSSAVTLLKNMTTELNCDKIPFQFKILIDPNNYTRVDAGVLYMNKKYLEKSNNALQKIYEQTKSSLKTKTPLFAKKLASGVSLAEDPNNGESFGQHRTRILAEVLCDMQEKKITSNSEKMERISAYFKDFRVDIHTPYQSLDSDNNYEDILKGVFD